MPLEHIMNPTHQPRQLIRQIIKLCICTACGWSDFLHLRSLKGARHFCGYEGARSGDQPQQISSHPQI